MKKINLSLACFTALTFIGCGAGGSIESNTNNTAGNDSSTTETTVLVERGPVFGATVKDSSNPAKEAKNKSNNTYVFTTNPTYPIIVTGGGIDVNGDNLITTADYPFDITMSSYSNIVSPLTTYIGNDSTKLEDLKTTYSLTEDQIKNQLPSSVSKTTILLSNALYKFIDNNTLNFKSEYTSLVGTSTQDDKKLFAKELEEYVLITDLGKTALTTTQINTINTKIWDDNNLNQTLTKTKTTSDTVSDIWNIGLNVSANQSISDFDIAVNIVKSSSGTIGNIVIEDISIANNQLTAANKVSIFGKKTSGSTSSIAYDSTKNITKNAVALVQGKLLIDLGYIIKNQDVVSESSFTNASNYAVTVYITKLDTSNTVTTANESVQTTYNTSITIPSGSQKITGTISIVGAN